MTLYNTASEVDLLLESLESLHKGELFTVSAKPSARDTVPELFAGMPLSQRLDQRTIEARLLNHSGWQERYRQIMLLGKELPSLPEDKKTDEALLRGCESRVWLHHYYDEETRCLYFLADSDARIIRGLIALVLAVLNSKTSAEIAVFDLDGWFNKLDLLDHLSPSRGSGLKAIVLEIRSVAKRYM